MGPRGNQGRDRGTARVARSVAGTALCIPLALFAIDVARTALPSFAGAVAAQHQAQRFVLEPKDVSTADAMQKESGGSRKDEPASHPSVDWESLLAANPNAAGWVHVPGTRISSAVVQAPPSDPHRYLDHDLLGNENPAGCPYVSAACAPFGGIDANFVVIYGHNLANGGMFADFARYADAAYAEDRRTVYLPTPAGVREATVVGVDVVDADTELIAAGFGSTENLEAYLRKKLAEGEVSFALPASIKRVYAFVCCSYQAPNHRTVVYAVEQ